MEKLCPFRKEECIQEKCALYVCVPGKYLAEDCAISLTAWKIAGIHEVAANIEELAKDIKKMIAEKK